MSPEPPAPPRALDGRGGRRGGRLWAGLTGVDDSLPPDWTRPRPDRAGLRVDLLIGVGVAVLIALTNWATFESGIFEVTGQPIDQPLWLGIVMPFVLGATMAARRRFPQAALAVATIAYFVALSLGYLEVMVAPNVTLFLFYSAGAWSTHRASVTVLRLAAAGVQMVWGLLSAFSREATTVASYGVWENATFGALTLILNVVLYIAVFWLGNSQYVRAGQWETMNRQFEELRESRAQLADQAVRLDRIRIARELHDSVAHHVSLMGVQAAVARKMLETLPATEVGRAGETAGAAMELVESNAREAIEELQGILVALRSEDGGEATDAPSTRTLDQVPALIDSARAAGMNVEFHEYGERPATTALAELTVYRVLQEALTNVRKHAGAGARADARLRYAPDSIEVDVTDDGRGGGRAHGAGKGLTGMRERALAVGGTVTAGPRETRGYRVLLRVPLRADAATTHATGHHPGIGHEREKA